MSILKRLLIDYLVEAERDFLINMDSVEGDYSFDLYGVYDELLNQFLGHDLIIFQPKDMMDRDLNKRVFDLALEAGVEELLLILPLMHKENTSLIEYSQAYSEIKTNIIELSGLMDNLYFLFSQNRQPKELDNHMIAAKDAFEFIKANIFIGSIDQPVHYKLYGGSYKNTIMYHLVFSDSDRANNYEMEFNKNDAFILKMGRKPLSWPEFIKMKEVS